MLNRKTLLKRTIAALGLGLIALLPQAMAQAPKTAELKIGFISALSGAGLSWGMGMLGGLQMAVDEVNAKGGLKIGDTTYNVKLVPHDDKYNGQEAALGAERLVSQEGVKFIVGPLGSVSMLAIADITERNKVLVLSNSYTVKALNPNKRYTFRLTPTTFEFAEPMTAWIAKNRPKLKTVAVVSPNDESGKEVLAHSSAGYQKAGIKVAGTEFYERGTQDFVPLLTKLLAYKPDIIDVDGSPPVDSGAIIKQARQIGFTGQFVKVGGPGVAEIVRVAGAAADGLLYYSPWDPNDKAIVDLSARFQAKYKLAFNPLGIFFYEGGHMLLESIKTARSVDPEVVRKQLESQKEFRGLLGRYVWSGQASYGIAHQWVAPFYIGEVQKGKEAMLVKIEP